MFFTFKVKHVLHFKSIKYFKKGMNDIIYLSGLFNHGTYIERF